PLMALRHQVFDRYLILLLPAITLSLLLFYQARGKSRPSAFGWVLLGVFALYGIATTHDYYAMGRARLAAASALMASGVPRTQITAGLEYDGWTQIEKTGYMNNEK